MKKSMFVTVFSVVLLLSSVIVNFSNTAFADGTEITIDGGTGWENAYPINFQNDFLDDQQTGSTGVSQDIVGDETYPSTFMQFSSEEVGFKIRLDSCDGTVDSPEFKNFAFIGLDADLDGSIDFFLGVYNPTGSNGRLGIYAAEDGYANVSPSTTGISGKPLSAFEPVAGDNYSILQADTAFTPDQDYFLSFKFSVDDITAALQGTGYTFDETTAFRFMTGTAAQDNSFNQDLNGMDGNGWYSDDDWSSIGVLGPIVSPDGSTTKVSVTFDKNTGDTDANPNYKVIDLNISSMIGELPTEPTKRGMEFVEWNTEADGSGDTVTASTEITTNTTVYAIWAPIYTEAGDNTVTFEAGSNKATIEGSSGPVVVNNVGSIVGSNMPADPVHSQGYEFAGWEVTVSDGTLALGTLFSEITEINGDVTVTAQWINTGASSVAAVFYDNYSDGIGEVATIYSNNGSNFSNQATPTITRPGYTLTGWMIDNTGTLYVPGENIPSAGNYYAQWTPNTYTVDFDLNYNSPNIIQTNTVNNAVLGDMPDRPTREGYEFVEWNKLSDGTGEAMYPTSQVLSSFTVYAIWKPAVYVTFDPNNGTPSGFPRITAVDGSLTISPQPPEYDNHTFMGWSYSNTNDASTIIDNVRAETFNTNTTLYAVWEPVYTVTFNENYGADPATTDVLTSRGNVSYTPVPQRQNYTFDGWYTNPDGTGIEFTTSTDVNSNVTVYAKWTPNPAVTYYNVTYTAPDATGGVPVDSTNYSENESVSVSMMEPVRDDYTFAGWTTSFDSNIYDKDGPNSSFNMPAANVTLTATWISGYTVTYSAPDADTGSPMPVDEAGKSEGDLINVSATEPTKTGAVFGGWKNSADGVIYDPSTSFNMPDGNVTLTAVWDYTVTYSAPDSNGGIVPSDQTGLNENDNVAIAVNQPTRTGYVFDGWKGDTNGDGYVNTTIYKTGTANSSFVMPDKNVALVAQWTAGYAVTYDDGVADSSVSSMPNPLTKGYAVNDNVNISLTEPTREGYTFAAG